MKRSLGESETFALLVVGLLLVALIIAGLAELL